MFLLCLTIQLRLLNIHLKSSLKVIKCVYLSYSILKLMITSWYLQQLSTILSLKTTAGVPKDRRPVQLNRTQGQQKKTSLTSWSILMIEKGGWMKITFASSEDIPLPHQRKRHPTLKQTESLHMFLCPPSSQIKSLMEIWEVINRINTQSFGRGYSHRRFQNLTIAKIGFNPPSLNSGTLGGFDDKKCVNATRKS